MKKFNLILWFSITTSAMLTVILTLTLVIILGGGVRITAPYGEAPLEIFIFILGIILNCMVMKELKRNGFK